MCTADNLTTFMRRLSRKLGALPPGTLRVCYKPVQGYLYLYQMQLQVIQEYK